MSQSHFPFSLKTKSYSGKREIADANSSEAVDTRKATGFHNSLIKAVYATFALFRTLASAKM